MQAHAAPGCVCRARLLLYFPKCVMHRQSMLLARRARDAARIRQAFVLSLVLRCSCCWCRVLLRVTGVLVSTERASAKRFSLHSDFPPHFFNVADTTLLNRWRAKGTARWHRSPSHQPCGCCMLWPPFAAVRNVKCRVKRPSWVKFCEWRSFDDALQALK